MKILIQSSGGRKPQWRDLVSRWLTSAFGILLASRLFDGVSIDGEPADAMLLILAASAVLGVVNALLRPLLLILTLPINILSLGLFTLVINGGLLALVSHLIPGFHIDGVWTAVGAALLVGIVNFVLGLFSPGAGTRVKVERGNPGDGNG